MKRRPSSGLGIAGLLVLLASPASAHLKYTPQVGDWEGTANGFPASFQLLHEPSYPARYRRPPYGYEDVVTLVPASCPVAAYNYSEGVIGQQPFVTPLASNGSFGLPRSYGVSGGVTGARSALVRVDYRLPGALNQPACLGALRWHLHPARRRLVRDGTWKLRFSDGEAETFTVKAGGRLATGIGLPRGPSGCLGVFGGVDLFVAPGGLGRLSNPQQGLTVSLTFTGSSTANGQLAEPASPGCAATLTMTASLSKRAP